MSCVYCGCCPSKAAESAEQLSEALLEDLLEDTESRLRSPTLDSMLLRMEEIQVRAANKRAHQQKVSMEPEKVTGDGVVIYSKLWSSDAY